MNREVIADELDQQIEGVLSGKRTIGVGSGPLLALASELYMLPDPEFKTRLAQFLLEEDAEPALSEWSESKVGTHPLVVAQSANHDRVDWRQPASLGALTPLFGGKHTG